MESRAQLEALRDLLSSPPSAELWAALVAHIDAAGGLDAVELDYVEDHLTAWPDRLRVLPIPWMEELMAGQAAPAWFRLARRFNGAAWAWHKASPGAYDHEMAPGYELEDDMKRLAGSALMLHLRELDLASMPYGFRELLASPMIKRLDVLVMGSMVSEEDVRSLMERSWVKDLGSLTAATNNRGSAAAWAEFVGEAGPPRLYHLDLGHSPFDDACMESLVGSGHSDGLEVLRLGYTRLGDGGVDWLSESKARLIELDLGLCRASLSSLQGLMQSRVVRGLRTLALPACELNRGHAAALASSPCLPGLTRLDLSHNALNGPSIERLVGGTEPLALTELSVRNNAIGDMGAFALARSPVLGALRKLSVRECGLSVRALEALASAPGLASVEELDVMHNPGAGAAMGALTRRFARVVR